jgi:mannose-1-phosphate guanylyltransferase
MKMNINGILLSAGLGTRLMPFTKTVPKPAIPFLGVPLAYYPLHLFDYAKINNLVINTHHLPNEIKNLCEKINWPCKNLIFSSEERKILGSGGGIRHAINHLIGKGNFFVANADEIILPENQYIIEDAYNFHLWHKGIATLLVIQHPDVGTKFGGAWVEHGTKVQKFSKTPIAQHQGYHFIGILFLSDRIKDYFLQDDTQEENILYDTLSKAMGVGEEVHVHEVKAQWFETGNPADFILATETCLASLEDTPQSPWVQHLSKIIKQHGQEKFVVEADKPELVKKIKAALSSLQK